MERSAVCRLRYVPPLSFFLSFPKGICRRPEHREPTFVISTGVFMGLRPTQGNENRVEEGSVGNYT